jgi:5-formyltetrahydrofolate cyclo-ligase
MRSKLETLSFDERHQKSLLIGKKLFKLGAFRKARTVCFYVGTDREVDTVPMVERAITMGKRVLLPRVNLENKELKLFEIKNVRAQLLPGSLGILEPDPNAAKEAFPGDIECIIVPGLAFDAAKRRLGRGAGFYDRFLAQLPSGVFKVALAFSFQVFPEIPHEAHDQTLDEVLTEK